MPNSRAKLRAVLAQAKAGPCTDCGRTYPVHVLDLDHVRGEKLSNVADLVGERRGLAALHAEIAKCEVVCANCHRQRTWSRRQQVLTSAGPPSQQG